MSINDGRCQHKICTIWSVNDVQKENRPPAPHHWPTTRCMCVLLGLLFTNSVIACTYVSIVSMRWLTAWSSKRSRRNWVRRIVIRAGGTEGTGGRVGIFSPDFGQIRRRTCSIKRPCITACPPASRFSDLPPDLVMMIIVLTVILKPTQSFQKAEAENFLRMTVLVPKRILEHVATCPPEEWYMGRWQ